jgi:hypothetical protein
MSQNSLTLPTTGTVSGLQMTQYANNAIDTLNTLASGASAPGSPEAGQLWHDTTNNVLKLRSLDNTSWIAVLSLNESSYLSAPYAGGVTSGGNRIINGGMLLDQANEGTSYSIPVNNTFTYTLDQWEVACLSGSASGVTAQQVSDAPPGFTRSLKATVGTGAGSVGTSDYFALIQPIEANNLNDLGYGNSNAMATSLSFWVKSSVTGDFGVSLGNTTGGNRQLVHKFTIASAAVWQLVTVPNIAGDQAGTWGTGAGSMLNLTFALGAGTNYQTSTLDSWQGSYVLAPGTQTNNVLTTSGATFQITGVQFNTGAFCLPFEKKEISQELLYCERYYQKSFPQGTAVAQNAGVGGAVGIQTSVTGTFGQQVYLRTTMRTTPSIVTYNPAAANANWHDYSNSADRTASIGGNTSDKGLFIFGASGVALSTNNIHYAASARM